MTAKRHICRIFLLSVAYYCRKHQTFSVLQQSPRHQKWCFMNYFEAIEGVLCKITPTFCLNQKPSDETDEWNSNISLTCEYSLPNLFFSPYYLGSLHMSPKIMLEDSWAVKSLNFKKFQHLSPAATWVCQNPMWLNVTLTWQIGLKWKKFRDERFHHRHLFLSFNKYRISPFFSTFLTLPPSFSLSCLGDWWSWGEPECERGPQRADEDCLHKACLKAGTVASAALCVCVGEKKLACVHFSKSVCVFSVVSTPHSLIKGRGQPLKWRLSLKE